MVVFAVGCSSNEDDNESIETQTFLEKYDGVVWLEDQTGSSNDYAFLIQFLNTSKSFVDNEMANGINGISNCDNIPLTGITENTENTFVFDYERGTVTCTVSNQGNSLSFKYQDKVDSSYNGTDFYSRSKESMKCN